MDLNEQKEHWTSTPQCQSFTLCLARLFCHNLETMVHHALVTQEHQVSREWCLNTLAHCCYSWYCKCKPWKNAACLGTPCYKKKFCWVCWATDFIHVVLVLGENKKQLHWTEPLLAVATNWGHEQKYNSYNHQREEYCESHRQTQTFMKKGFFPSAFKSTQY